MSRYGERVSGFPRRRIPPHRMKSNSSPRVAGSRGITLIELSVVVVVLLLVITIMFIGASAWKRGSDRAGCVLNLRSVQVAARSYQNLYGYQYGGRPYAEYGTQDIARHLFEKGYIEQGLYDQARGVEPCPGGGSYSTTAADVFPMPGQLYLQCSLSAPDAHAPDAATSADW